MNKEEYLKDFLRKASDAYYSGRPIISDEQYDYLESQVQFDEVGHKVGAPVKHLYRMYSLQKYYINEGKAPLIEYTKPKVTTPKLDGAAISLVYVDGILIRALTRGDGIEGQDITEKFLYNPKSFVPLQIQAKGVLQVVGEVVAPKEIPNARNYASGALNLNSLEEFNKRDLHFIAYGITPSTDFYLSDIELLKSNGFNVVTDESFCEQFPHDGLVIRVNSNLDYENFGYTAKHPRGAYALKERKAGAITTLVDVVWQTGKTGRVTPVAILEPVIIGEALVSRATLNNPNFIRALELDIGDKVEVIRSGEIIPCIVRKI